MSRLELLNKIEAEMKDADDMLKQYISKIRGFLARQLRKFARIGHSPALP